LSGTLSKVFRWWGNVGSTARYATVSNQRLVTPYIWIETLNVAYVSPIFFI